MKKKIFFGTLMFITILATTFCIDAYHDRCAMENVTIMHYIAGSGSGYSTVYLTAIVPAESYSEDRTIKVIQRYVLQRNREIPDTLRIILYDSMESFQNADSFFEKTFHH